MIADSQQSKMAGSKALRTGLKGLAILTSVAAFYVWILMLSYREWTWNSFFSDESDRLASLAYLVDSISLLLLIFGFLVRSRLNLVAWVGLGLSVLNLGVRLTDYFGPSNWMFWFEPYLRSGVYVIAFASAIAARRLSRSRYSPGSKDDVHRTKMAEQTGSSNGG